MMHDWDGAAFDRWLTTEPDQDDPDTCPDCGGTGQVRRPAQFYRLETLILCPRCKGTGDSGAARDALLDEQTAMRAHTHPPVLIAGDAQSFDDIPFHGDAP